MDFLQMGHFMLKVVMKEVFNEIDSRQQQLLKASLNADNFLCHVTYPKPGL
jgi:hypothetical protein